MFLRSPHSVFFSCVTNSWLLATEFLEESPPDLGLIQIGRYTVLGQGILFTEGRRSLQ